MDLDTQRSDDNTAIVFRNVNKSYHSGSIPVLENFNMSVPKGHIYGLLGANGCGKTTVLNIAVGLLRAQAGEVKVLGGTPGEKNSAVPGPRLGFMPQDSALSVNFTVVEVIYYFGWLNGMEKQEIEERFEFLSELLDLPSRNQVVNTLSGGEQRRLSFSAAVIHSPELLILDEPTVGLDPILKQILWDYMMKLSAEQHVTILYTTHYIQEAIHSHTVGLLRNGVLLDETSPRYLISKHNCNTLEEVFFILSQIQSGQPVNIPDNHDQPQCQDPGPSSRLDPPHNDVEKSPLRQEFSVESVKVVVRQRGSSFWRRMKALLFKDILEMYKNKEGLIFNVVYPLLLIFTFFLAVGAPPKHLSIGIVNEELGNCYDLSGGIGKHSGVQLMDVEEETQCLLRGMSCLYINSIQ